MTIHSPQANCLAIVQNFGNFWGDCLNLTLLIKKRCTYYVPNFHSHRQGHREGGWGGSLGGEIHIHIHKFTFFENLPITHIRNYFSLEYSLILLFSY